MPDIHGIYRLPGADRLRGGAADLDRSLPSQRGRSQTGELAAFSGQVGLVGVTCLGRDGCQVEPIHIAGHSKYEKYILDTHDHPVIDPVWQLYARAIERCGPTPTLLEWDDHIPSFDEVHAEAKKAQRYLHPVLTDQNSSSVEVVGAAK